MTENIPATPAVNEQRPWTSKELQRLEDNGHLGAVALADLLDRSPGSVRGAAYRSRISLRRKGSRCGSVLGQPRGVSLRRDIREDIVSGRVSDELLARRMQADHDAETCPTCGRRPIRVRTTGRCLVCHREALAAAHLEALEEQDAERAMWSTRQALTRERHRVATT